MAVDAMIARVRCIVPPGDMPPENVVTPGIFVDRVLEVPVSERTMTEQGTDREVRRDGAPVPTPDRLAGRPGHQRRQLRRPRHAGAGGELHPRRPRNRLPLRKRPSRHGSRTWRERGRLRPDQRRQETRHLLPGAAFFHHADSFPMVRGGHIDICVPGAFQVSARPDPASWSTGREVHAGIAAYGCSQATASGRRSCLGCPVSRRSAASVRVKQSSRAGSPTAPAGALAERAPKFGIAGPPPHVSHRRAAAVQTGIKAPSP